MLIGLSGKAGSGKDTLAAYLAKEKDFIAIAYADPVKKGLQAMFNLEHKWLHDTDAKEEDIPDLGVSGRVLMQTLGTEWGRNLLDEDIWVNIVRRKIMALDSFDIVVTDVRFDNEAALIKEMGGILIEVRRDFKPAVGILGHASEKGLTKEHDRFILDNDGTKEEMFALAETVLAKG